MIVKCIRCLISGDILPGEKEENLLKFERALLYKTVHKAEISCISLLKKYLCSFRLRPTESVNEALMCPF